MTSNRSNSSARIKEVIDRAKEIIEDKAYFPNPPYHVAFRHHKGRRNATVIAIYNSGLPPNEKIFSPHGVYCIRCQIYEDDPSTLYIGLLTRCGLNGTEHLKRLIAFSKACGLSRITLEDESKINYATTENATYSEYSISLQQLQWLMTGQSWYGHFGFTNNIIKDREEDIKDYIKRPIVDVNPELLSTIQQLPLQKSFYLKNNGPVTVSKAVKYLYEYLKMLCPDRICDQEDLIYINKINDILNEIYQQMLLELKMNAYDFINLELILSHQKGSSRKNKTTRRRKRTLRR